MGCLRLKKVLLAVLLFLSISVSSNSAVYVVKLTGVINPPLVDYVLRGLKVAESHKSPLLIEIDTPGGLLESTRVWL